MNFLDLPKFTWIVLGLSMFFGPTQLIFAISLKDACHEALLNSKELGASKVTLESVQAKLNETKAKYGPTLDVSASVGRHDQALKPELQIGDEGSTFQNWRSTALLGLNWTIWDGGLYSNSLELGKLSLSLAEVESIQKSWQVLRDVSQKYLALYRAISSIGTLEDKAKNLHRQKEGIEAKVKNGLLPGYNLVEIDGQIQKLEARKIALIRALRSARSALALAVGSSVIAMEPIGSIEQLDFPKIPQPKAVLWEQTLAAKVFQIQERSDAANLKQLELEHGPRIDVGSNVDLGTSQFVGTGDSPAQNRDLRSSVHVTVRYRIWDWGQREYQKSALIATQKAAVLQRSQQRLVDTSQIDDLRGEAVSIEAQRSVDLKVLDLEKQRFELMEQNYREGKVSYLDLVTAIDSLASSQQALEEDNIALEVNKIELHTIAGSIYDAIFKI